MTLNRKKNTYFVDGLSAKSDKHIFSKNFKTVYEAMVCAEEWKEQGKIVQAEIDFTKNILSDITVWELNTNGIFQRYNKETKKWDMISNIRKHLNDVCLVTQ